MIDRFRNSKIYSYLNNNHFLSLTGNVVMAGMSVLSSSLIFRTLHLQEAGMWVLFTTMLGLIDSIRAGFLTTAFIRSYSGATPTRAAEVMGSTWFIGLLITSIFIVLNVIELILPIPVNNESLDIFFHWFSVTFIATLPGFIAGCVLQAEMRFDKLLYLRFISQGLFITGIAFLVLTKQMSLIHLLYVNIGREVLTSSVALSLGWTNFRMLKNRSTECVKEIAHFGKYSIGSFIGSVLLRDSDTFVINFMLGSAALAVYNIAQRFMEFIEIPLRSSIATAMPAMSAAFNQHDKARLGWVMQRYAGVVTWALVPIIISMFIGADLLIYLLGGSKYAGTEAANVLRIFLVIAILFPIDRYFGVALDVINRPKMNLIKVFITIIMSVTTNILGVKILHNVYGVAIASAPTIAVGFIFGYFAFNRYKKLSVQSIIETGFEESKKIAFGFVAKLRPAKPQ